MIKRTLMALTLVVFSINAFAWNDIMLPTRVPDENTNNYLYTYPHPVDEMWAEPVFHSDGSAEYKDPMIKGERLDFCYKHGRYCGRVAANSFCQQNGYRYATRFYRDRNIGVTRTIGDNRVKRHASRDGFRWIKCRSYIAPVVK